MAFVDHFRDAVEEQSPSSVREVVTRRLLVRGSQIVYLSCTRASNSLQRLRALGLPRSEDVYCPNVSCRLRAW